MLPPQFSVEPVLPGAPWGLKREAYDRALASAWLVREWDEPSVTHEGFDQDFGQLLEPYRGLSGYEYLDEVEAVLDQRDVARRAVQIVDPNLAGCSDDPPF